MSKAPTGDVSALSLANFPVIGRWELVIPTDGLLVLPAGFRYQSGRK